MTIDKERRERTEEVYDTIVTIWYNMLHMVSLLIEHLMVVGSLDVYPLIDVIRQAIPDEILALIADGALLSIGKVDHTGLQHDTLIQDAHLAHLIAERLLPEDHLVVDDADRPHVHLRRYHCLLVRDEALGRQVPVCPHALGGELQVFVLGGLAETEISDLDPALVEEDVLGLQVIVDHLVRQFVQILDGTHDLPEDESCLLLRDALMLLEVMRKVRALAILHDRAER